MQDFERLRKDGKYYVDKTTLIYEMTHTDCYYFLSRPRRFGKSLLISTLQCYFEGKKELFTGLAMERLETEWKRYPVIRLDMSLVKYIDDSTLDITLNKILSEYEELYGVEADPQNHVWGVRLASIIDAAYKQTGKEVVVLVDEYDTPMLDTFGCTNFDEIRNKIRSLYSPLKALGGKLRFVFLTGITKFSQLSIFSELNNLKVITMSDKYAPLCGITKEELLEQMAPEIQALADSNGMSYEEACAALKRQYDGYHFSKKSPDIYNPYSLINALADGEIQNYWFSTGTPTVLTKLIKKYDMNPQDFEAGFPATLGMFDTPAETATDPIPMLYQSGYLTIKDYDEGEYKLGFPNEEVKLGFLKVLMPCYAAEMVSQNDIFLLKFTRALKESRLDDAMNLMRAFLSSIPYNAEKQDESVV